MDLDKEADAIEQGGISGIQKDGYRMIDYYVRKLAKNQHCGNGRSDCGPISNNQVTEEDKMRSDMVEEAGKQLAPHRSLFNALGLTKEDGETFSWYRKFFITDRSTGHMNLDKIVNASKEARELQWQGEEHHCISGNKRL